MYNIVFPNVSNIPNAHNIDIPYYVYVYFETFQSLWSTNIVLLGTNQNM